MSNAIFPVLSGQGWNTIKTPMWSTKIQTSRSGRELRLAYYNIPIYKFSLTYEFLRAGTKTELQQLMSFFNARQGSFDTFLYDDVTDNTATNVTIGIGDGNNKSFQMARIMSWAIEPVFAPKSWAITLNGSPASGVSVDANIGVVTFAVAPAPGAIVAWSGTFYYRCRFATDSQDFENFMMDLWVARKVDFQSVKP